MANAISRREFLRLAARGGAGAMALASLPTGAWAQAGVPMKRPNVLFLPVDDLRPELGCYGASYMHTPNIDVLAARGTVFSRAYCQQAVCAPSRASLMTGLHCSSIHLYDLRTHFRTTVPDVVTLSQHFKRCGYHAEPFGKIYHGGVGHPMDDRPSWSAKGGCPSFTGPNRYRNVPSWQSLDVGDSDLPDGQIADMAIQCMRRVKDRPFFLAAGFIRPHLPFVAPKKYYDMYPESSITLPDNMFAPRGAPDVALTKYPELRNYSDIPSVGEVDEKKARDLIRGYRASTSYTDAQIGRVLAELDALGLRDNTIVVLWGDHGWHLGEHGMWCKHTNFEVATRSPLIISAPGQEAPGKTTGALTEFVDIYPTLCELADIPLPEHLQGTSAAPLLDKPDRTWKTAAFGLYPRWSGRSKAPGVRVMGYTMRTDRHRYTEWVEYGRTGKGVPQQQVGWITAKDKPAWVELYDHEADPDENVNVADKPENVALVNQLAGALRAGWKSARPKV